MQAVKFNYFTFRRSKGKSLLVSDNIDLSVSLDQLSTLHGQSKLGIFGTTFDLTIKVKSSDNIMYIVVPDRLQFPQQLVCDAFRSLRLGVYAIYTVPVYWRLYQQPLAFFSYTEDRLTHLLESTGLSLIDITSLSGFLIAFETEWSCYLNGFSRGGIKSLIQSAIAESNLYVSRLDRPGFREKRFTLMWFGVLRKPMDSQNT